MKNLIIAFVLLFSAQSFAADLIAEYQFGYRDYTDQNSTALLYTVTLDEVGALKVYQQPLTFAAVEEPNELLVEKELHPENFRNLKSTVVTLANAEIVEQFSPVVCLVAVSIEQSYDHLTVARDYNFKAGEFLGLPQLVQGPVGCWVSHKVYPKVDRDNQVASGIKGKLRSLALELITL